MPAYTDALRGYAATILARDGYRCRYCGLDGTTSVSNWLALSEDHLLLKDHPKRNNEEYRVAACRSCNEADNRYLEKAAAAGLDFDGMMPDELIARRRQAVLKTREQYQRYWKENVATKAR